MKKVLSLDPSLTCTGWCIADENDTPKVHRVGKIVPDKKLKSVGDRTDSIVDQVQHLILEHLFNERDHIIVIEMPSARKFRSQGGDGHGLANYGSCVGAVRQMCRAISGRVYSVPSDSWTGGRSKDKRRVNALRYYKHLSKIKDPGYDVSDAISLAIWWCQIGRGKSQVETAKV